MYFQTQRLACPLQDCKVHCGDILQLVGHLLDYHKLDNVMVCGIMKSILKGGQTFPCLFKNCQQMFGSKDEVDKHYITHGLSRYARYIVGKCTQPKWNPDGAKAYIGSNFEALRMSDKVVDQETTSTDDQGSNLCLKILCGLIHI